MSSLTTHPAGLAANAHRTQIIAQAVVSAYIHEITATDRARARRRCTESPPTSTARSPLAAQARRRTPARGPGPSAIQSY